MLQEIDLTRFKAIYGTKPVEEVSNRYTFVPTYTLIEDFKRNGWIPISANQRGSKKGRTAEYNMHKIVFAPKEFLNDSTKDIIPNIILYNSHDRSFALTVKLGCYRRISQTFLIINDQQLEDFYIKHQDKTFESIQKLIEKAMVNFQIIADKIEEYKSIELTHKEKNMFALQAMQIAWGTDQKFDVAQLLNLRRMEDDKNDLFTTMSRAQENIIKGGLVYRTEKNKVRHTRRVKGIIREYNLNIDLWILMEKFRIEKKGE